MPASADPVDGAARKEGADIVGQHGHQALPGLQALPAHVGGQDDVFHRIEGIVRGRRLGLLHVQAGAGDLSGLQGLDEGRLVDEGAPGGVDDAGRRLHLLKGLPVDDVPGLGGQGTVEGEIVRAAQQLVQRAVAHAFAVGPGRAGIDQHLHIQRPGQLDDFAADGPFAQNAQGLAVDLGMLHSQGPGEVAVVAPFQHADLPLHIGSQGQKQQDGRMGHPLGAVSRDVADGDALLPGGLQGDIVIAGAGFTDQAQAVGHPQHLFGGQHQLLGDGYLGPFQPGQDLFGGAVGIDGDILAQHAVIDAAVVIDFLAVENDDLCHM